MNLAHDIICSSRWWARGVQDDLLPWGLQDVDLGPRVLELGPGFGATTRVLCRAPVQLTVLEPETRYCQRLERELGGRAEIVQGDGTRMPFDEDRFSAVVCFTMLHHVPARELQDRLLEEVARVLGAGGVFAGTDSRGHSLLFKAIHIGEHLQLVEPADFGQRLESAGFVDPQVDTSARSMRFRARAPA